MKQLAKRARRKPAMRLTDGGNPVLNFINTRKKDSKGNHIELLTNYSTFLNWCEDVKLIDWDRWLVLDLEQYCYGPIAEMIWCNARLARECLDEMINNLVAGEDVHPLLIERFNGWIAEMRPSLRYGIGPYGLKQYWHNVDEEINFPFWLILNAACDMLDNKTWRKVKKCPICESLFMDNSRSHNRTWCHPATCGSVKKSKRYFAMKKAV